MKIMLAPARYAQGAGAFAEAGAQVARLGKHALVVGGKKAMDASRGALMPSLKDAGVKVTEVAFEGECSWNEIDRLAAIGRDSGADVVVSVGGGKVHDTGKMVAHKMKTPMVVMPTIAATDAPCSALSVVYTPEGVFSSYEFPPSPDLVLVDTAVVAKAPVRLLVSGMGDALATWFEAEACYKTKAGNMAGAASTEAALALARLCYDLITNYGVEAKAACEAGVVTPALERVVEANTLLSGLGFESSGLAAAHAVHNGMTAIPEMHHMYHGEKVAFGTLTQLVMQDAPREVLGEVLAFCVSVGLPVTLAELGLEEWDRDVIMKAAQMATAPGETIHNMPFKVTADMVADAMIGADALGRLWVD